MIKLPIQKTNFDCAVGACLSATVVLQYPYKYNEIFQELNPKPKIGTDHDELALFCKKNFDVLGYGENTYKGGVAILNITISKVGHYVLALGKKDTSIIFWCSWVGLMVCVDENELKWYNGSKTTEKWSVNLSKKDFFEEVENFIPNENTIYNHDLSTYIIDYKTYEQKVSGLEHSSLKHSKLIS